MNHTCDYCPDPAVWWVTAGQRPHLIIVAACRAHVDHARDDAATHGTPTVVEITPPGRAA